MKPALFDYHAPTTVDDVVTLLQRHGNDTRLLAGGQTLIPMMNFRLATPDVVIDLNRVAELSYIKLEDGFVRFGAMTRQRAIEFSPIVDTELPLLHKAIRHVGHLPTRSRGTIGGSIANADAAAEIPMVLQALGGAVRVRGPGGDRTISASDLFVDAMGTSLAADEVLTEVRLPAMPKGARCAVEEFSRRRGDFAIGAIAVMIVQTDGLCRQARIATAGISTSPRRLMEAEAALEGHTVDDASIKRAAEAAIEAVEPLSDRNASADFRRHLTKVLTERALRTAMA